MKAPKVPTVGRYKVRRIFPLGAPKRPYPSFLEERIKARRNYFLLCLIKAYFESPSFLEEGLKGNVVPFSG